MRIRRTSWPAAGNFVIVSYATDTLGARREAAAAFNVQGSTVDGPIRLQGADENSRLTDLEAAAAIKALATALLIRKRVDACPALAHDDAAIPDPAEVADYVRLLCLTDQIPEPDMPEGFAA